MKKHDLKVLLIGLDGVNLDLIHRLLPKDAMPVLNSIIDQGMSGNLRSVFPTHSASAWASFMTGSNPSSHGVFDFKIRLPNGRYRHAKPQINQTLWHIIGSYDDKVGVFNFPVTFPPDTVNGWLVSGMLSTRIESATYPPSLGSELRKRFPNYRIDVEWMLYENRPNELLKDLMLMVQQHSQVTQFLLNSIPIDCLFIAITATDRAQHALWRYLDPKHPYYIAESAHKLQPIIYKFYRTLDESVEILIESCNKDTIIVLLSDHGFQSAAWQFHVNEWLAKNEWLYFHNQQERFIRWIKKFEPPHLRSLRRKIYPDISRHFHGLEPGGSIDWKRTKAYCPWNFHQGIRINRNYLEENRICIESNEYERLVKEISEGLQEIRNPINGELVIKSVYRVVEIYQGDYLNEMPDLVFELYPNYAPGIHQQHLFEPTCWASGDHNLDGFISIYKKKGIKKIDLSVELIDVAPTVLGFLGLPIPPFMQGTPIPTGLEKPIQAGRFFKRALDSDQLIKPDEGLSEEEEKKLLEQLKNLGYL